MALRIDPLAKAFLFAFLIFAPIAATLAMVTAQETPRGGVRGVVVHRDKEVYKGLVANAKVILSSEDRLYRATTNDRGEFTFADVPAGEYWFSVTAKDLVYGGGGSAIVTEGRVTNASALVMMTRPPELNLSTTRGVFTPDRPVKVNIRGYSRGNGAHLACYKLDGRSFLLRQQSSDGEPRPLHALARTQPLKEWDIDLNKDEEGFFETQAIAPTEGLGTYLLTATMGDITREIAFTISDLALVVKQAPGQLLTYCVDFTNHKPVSGAEIEVFESGSKIRSGRTDENGLLSMDMKSQSIVVLATKGASLASSASYVYSGEDDAMTWLIYTDRPIYRPGHTVFYKGILRRRDGNDYRTPPPTTVDVEIKSPAGETISEVSLETNARGTFQGEAKLPAEASLGEYSIAVDAGSASGEGSFTVSEYRKPDFKTTVTFDKDYFIAGTPITGSIDASYYFGAPVRNAEVHYTVFTSRRFWYSDERLFYESTIAPDDEADSEDYGEVAYEGDGKTDDDGRLRVSIPTSRKFATDLDYKVEVSVTDQGLRTVSASASAFVPNGLFRLEADTNSYLARPNREVAVDLKAIDYEDRPRAGTTVDISVQKETWEVRTRRRREIASGRVVTDADGKAVYRFTPSAEGYLVIEARTRDRLGSVIRTETDIWVAGDEYVSDGYEGEELQIVTDKDVYEPGDSARVLINSTAKDVYALMTVEGARIHSHRLIHLTGNSTVVELPALREYIPNAYISVCYVNGVNFVTAEEPFNVSPKRKFLNVSITSDKSVYKPGEMARYTVKTADVNGKPVSAEVSLGVVDESIYAIMEDQTPDPREHFYGPAYNMVSTSYSFPSYYMGGTDKEGTGRARRYFPDTALWEPDVVTGPDGVATVTMKTPDSLTTWRATALAITADTEVGSAVQKMRVTKDLIIRLQTPRFLTQNDEIQIGATVHNYTKTAQRTVVTLAPRGIRVDGPLSQTIDVRPNEVIRLSWDARAVAPGVAVLTASARGETDSDAVEVETPIRPHGTPVVAAEGGSVDREATVVLDFPKTAIPGSVQMEARIAPDPAGIMLGSLRYLADYEYDCMEQTMSRLLPAVVVADTLRRAGRPNANLERGLDDLVSKGLRRLYLHQRPDGGWGWWEGESDPYVTAYIIYGMARVKNAGVSVREDSYAAGVRALKGQLARFRKAADQRTPDVAPFSDMNERIYMLYALSLAGEADKDHVYSIYEKRGLLTSYGQALLALTLYELGDRARGDRVVELLSRYSQSARGMTHWEPDTRRWNWLGSRIETTACALRALTVHDPRDPRLREVVSWLTVRRRGERWESTKDTAAVACALADYLGSTPERLAPKYTAGIYVNGRLIQRREVGQQDLFGEEIVIPISPDALRAGSNRIRIAKDGVGDLFYSVALRYSDGQEGISARTAGVAVTRTYYRLRTSSNGEAGSRLTLVKAGDTVDIGDEILCRLTLKAGDSYKYVVIEDPRPAGWEPEQQVSGASYPGYDGEEGDGSQQAWDAFEVRDHKVAIFLSDLGSGVTRWEYRMRVETPGTFHSLPCTAYCMYVPQISGRSNEKVMKDRL